MWLRITAHLQVAFVDEPLTIKYGGHDDQLSKHYLGMDRFRIYALQKILDGGKLSIENHNAAQQMLIDKINVYLAGCIKRQKHEDIQYYQQLLDRYFQLC